MPEWTGLTRRRRRLVLGAVATAVVVAVVWLAARAWLPAVKHWSAGHQGLLSPEVAGWVAGLGAAALATATGRRFWAWVRHRDEWLHELEKRIPPGWRPEDWQIDRPAEVDAVVDRLLGKAETVAITTAIHGAGGMGKTTVAGMVCRDRRVLRRFHGQIFPLVLGRDTRGAALASKINGLVYQLTGDTAPFTDPQQAGQHLGTVLRDGPRRLLVIDDVWFADQLTPFTVDGTACMRLVTTRRTGTLPAGTAEVEVDELTDGQAQALLTHDLSPLRPELVTRLVNVTGRWAQGLRMLNGILRSIQVGPDRDAVAANLIDLLDTRGPTALDPLTGQPVDVDDAGHRRLTAAACIGASVAELTSAEHDRLRDLAVFAEDELIPAPFVLAMWRPHGVSDLHGAALLAKLADLALIRQHREHNAISIHDVIHDHLRADTPAGQQAARQSALIDAARMRLPQPAADPAAAEWWLLPEEDHYLQDHLIAHLAAGPGPETAEAVACDVRWMAQRIQRGGPAAVTADLTAAGTSTTTELRPAFERNAHLLTGIPAVLLLDVLVARLGDHAVIAAQFPPLLDSGWVRLTAQWPLPDLADPSLIRTLAGHLDLVSGVAIAPDGTWLASSSYDFSVRIWAADGQPRTTLVGHLGPLTGVAIAPDGTWLASSSFDDTAHTWTIAGPLHTIDTGHGDAVSGVAIAPDGTWLATGSRDGSVRIFETDGRHRTTLTGHISWVTGVAVSPDGTWLATSSIDKTVRIWTTDGLHQATLTGHTGRVNAVAIAPDGTWLATASQDETIQIWTADGRHQATLTGHTDSVNAVAIAPDGTWLATGSDDRTVRTWGADGQARAELAGHTDRVTGVAISPDGTWLATGSDDITVRIWAIDARTCLTTPIDGNGSMNTITIPRSATSDDEAAYIQAADGPVPAARTKHTDRVTAVAIAHDGNWLATSSRDNTVRIWDAEGRHQRTLTGHTASVTGVAMGPDGSWLASSSRDNTVRIWAPDGESSRILPGHTNGVTGVAIAPDGTWLASSSDDHTVRIWTPDNDHDQILTGHTSSVTGVAISPDGTWLATSSLDATVRIWNSAGLHRATLIGHDSSVTAVAIAPDGTWLATGSDDGTVKIWTASGRHQVTLPGHTDRVTGVAIALDGTWLASSSTDNTLRIWATAEPNECWAVMPVDSLLHGCAVWPDGSGIIAVGDAGIYRFNLHIPSHDSSRTVARL